MRRALGALVLLMALAFLVGCSHRTAQPEEPAPQLPRPDVIPGAPGERDSPARSVAFVDDRTGWIATEGKMLFGTTDGGRHWTKLFQFTTVVDQLDFVSPNLGWAVSEGSLLRTDDGGASWKSEHVPDVNVTRVDFVTDQTGWVGIWNGRAGSLYFTHDGGKTWRAVAGPCPQYPVRFSFVSQASGWAICGFDEGSGEMGKRLLRTEDAGATWTEINSVARNKTPVNGQLPLRDYIGSLFFFDAQHGWLTGTRYGTVVATTDGGSSWKDYTAPASHRITSVSFVSATHGYVVTDAYGPSVVMETADGGHHWVQRFPPLLP